MYHHMWPAGWQVGSFLPPTLGQASPHICTSIKHLPLISSSGSAALMKSRLVWPSPHASCRTACIAVMLEGWYSTGREGGLVNGAGGRPGRASTPPMVSPWVHSWIGHMAAALLTTDGWQQLPTVLLAPVWSPHGFLCAEVCGDVAWSLKAKGHFWCTYGVSYTYRTVYWLAPQRISGTFSPETTLFTRACWHSLCLPDYIFHGSCLLCRKNWWPTRDAHPQ